MITASTQSVINCQQRQFAHEVTKLTAVKMTWESFDERPPFLAREHSPVTARPHWRDGGG
jgi:hypothetical protein